MATTGRPQWQLPPGISRGTWDYAHLPRVAHDYDRYFRSNSLFEHDEQILTEYFHPPGLVADLGCGTGRALVPLARAGHRGLAVDLSRHMLQIVREKARLEALPILCLQANLVELDALAENVVDHAMCLFSTLGMIQGRGNRRQALCHFRRILKPGGRFVLHVHNLWYNLRDPRGPRWLARSLLNAITDREVELGDKWFPYRGVPRMFLHVFRKRELKADLRHAGFSILKAIPLNAPRRHALRHPWLLPAIRTNGWIVVCD